MHAACVFCCHWAAVGMRDARCAGTRKHGVRPRNSMLPPRNRELRSRTRGLRPRTRSLRSRTCGLPTPKRRHKKHACSKHACSGRLLLPDFPFGDPVADDSGPENACEPPAIVIVKAPSDIEKRQSHRNHTEDHERKKEIAQFLHDFTCFQDGGPGAHIVFCAC